MGILPPTLFNTPIALATVFLRLTDLPLEVSIHYFVVTLLEMIYIRLLLLVGLTFTCLASAAPFSTHQHRHCPSFEGSFSIENFKLYPENSDFDPINCRFYVG